MVKRACARYPRSDNPPAATQSAGQLPFFLHPFLDIRTCFHYDYSRDQSRVARQARQALTYPIPPSTACALPSAQALTSPIAPHPSPTCALPLHRLSQIHPFFSRTCSLARLSGSERCGERCCVLRRLDLSSCCSTVMWKHSCFEAMLIMRVFTFLC